MQKIVKIVFVSLFLSTLAYGYSHKYIKKIQTELTELGFYPGYIDGKMGPNTAEAIKAFQKSIGRRPTGRITKGLYWQLKNAVNSCTAGFSPEAEEYNGIKNPD